MRILRGLVVAALAGAALVVSGVALGVGPWPGLAQAVVAPRGDVRYTASRSGNSTTVRALRVGAEGGVLTAARFGGSWVYTLYHRGNGKPFIHALNTGQRFAVCIDLPWRARPNEVWNARLALSRDGRRLIVRSGAAVVATVDTKTFRVL